MSMYTQRAGALTLTLFGGTHERELGCTITGLPAGGRVDADALCSYMSRRSPRTGALASTPRAEDDGFTITSGFAGGALTGEPLRCVIPNKDVKPHTRPRLTFRPSHADYSSYAKYGAAAPDIFSGRMTAPMVFAGGIAKQLLSARGVETAVHIACIGSVADAPFDPLEPRPQFALLDPYFPLNNRSALAAMERELLCAREEGDSVGGAAECAAAGLSAGLGEPLFGSLKCALSAALFAIPGVCAVEFGAGEAISHMRGSAANDPFSLSGNTVRTLTNNSGGINGGISNGMPLIVRAAFRPVPTIARSQRTVDMERMTETEYAFSGRNDVCILPRGAVAVEAAVCFVLLGLILQMEVQDEGR